MIQAGRTFRIFVTSTFSDLIAERNALQKHVFPKLRELCTQYGCRFQAIDLRWGIREEASLDQQTMKICFQEIERCQKITPRPNLIVLLGDRYGWRPLPFEIPADEFKVIEQHISASEKKLLKQWYWLDANAVPPVYCLQPRRGEFEKNEKWYLVEEKLRLILLNGISAMELSGEKRAKYVTSATEQEIIHGFKNEDPREHVFCFFRTIKNAPQVPDKDFFDVDENGCLDEKSGKQLNKLKGSLRKAVPENIFEYEANWINKGITSEHIVKLCEDVYNSLAGVIIKEIAQLKEIGLLNKEISDHHAFGKQRSRFFVGRTDALARISDYLKGPSNQPLVVYGESGSGKTALMAYALQNVGNVCPDAKLVFRFIGATPFSSNGQKLLESLCEEISSCYAPGLAVSTEHLKLVEAFPKFLALATSKKPLILFLDALDQLSNADYVRNLMWLPKQLPENTKIIISCLPEEFLSTLSQTLPQQNIVKLCSMHLDEGEKLLDLLLHEAGRTIQTNQKQEILSKFAQCGKPLYLVLAFEEAKLLRSYTKDFTLKPDVLGVIHGLFTRLSSDANHGKTLVSHALGYLGAARNGLTEDELLDILSVDEVFQDFKQRSLHEPPEKKLPVIVWSRLYFDLEPYLVERSADDASLLTFYHNQFIECVSDEYLHGKAGKYLHQRLARYFDNQPLWVGERHDKPNRRKVSELPYQQTFSGLRQSLERTLSDLQFIEAKCTANVAYDLMEDYARLGLGVLARGALIVTAWLYDGRYGIFCPDCLAWSQISKSKLGHTVNCPECGLKLKINRFVTDAEWVPSNCKGKIQTTEKKKYTYRFSKKLEDFASFVSNNYRFLNFYPSMTLQQAANEPPDSAPEREAIRLLQSCINSPWLRAFKKTQDLPCLRVLTPFWEPERAPSANTGCFEISPDGKKVITAAAFNGDVKLIDFATGLEINKLSHKFGGGCCSFSPDGSKIVSLGFKNELTPRFLTFSSEDNKYEDNFELEIWDAATGSEIETIEQEGVICYSFAFSPDRHHIMFACGDGTLRLWNLDRKSMVLTINAYKRKAVSCAFSPDGKLAVSAGFDSLSLIELKIWNLRNGVKNATLTRNCRAYDDHANRAFFSADGKYVLSLIERRGFSAKCSALFANGLFSAKIWQLKNGLKKRHKIIKLEKDNSATSCAFSTNGKYVATGHENGVIALWSMPSGKELATFEAADTQVIKIAFSPDGKYIVSQGTVLKFWDLKKLISYSKNRLFDDRFLGNIVEEIIFSPNGTHLLTKAHTRYHGIDTEVWNRRTERVLPKPRGLDFYSFSPNGKEVLAVDASEQIVTMAMDMKHRRRKVLSGYKNGWHQGVYSPDGRFIAIWTNLYTEPVEQRTKKSKWPNIEMLYGEHICELKLFEAKEPTNSITLFEGKDLEIFNVFFLPGSLDVFAQIRTRAYLLEKFATSFIVRWDSSGKQRGFFALWNEIGEKSFSSDGKKIVIVSNGEAKLLDALTGAEVGKITDPEYFILACVFAKKGHVISLSETNIHKKFEAASRSPRSHSERRCPCCNKVVKIFDYTCPTCSSKTENKCLYCGKSMDDEDAVVCKNHNEELCAIPKYEIACWSLSTNEKATRIPVFRCDINLGKNVSPNCQWIAYKIADDIIQVSDLTTGAVVFRVGTKDCITALAWAPDSCSIAVGYRNGRIQSFELNNLRINP